jgi:predicted adenylyl cyclase CyaB
MSAPPDTPRPIANIEIKARCRDLAAARESARRLATRRLGTDRQVDTYFRTRSGRLKLRESSLSGGQLVPYLRADTPGPKRADYRVVPVEDAPGLRRLLGEILGVHRVVRKEREIFLVENVRIHLDRVDGLGEFVELEAVFDGSAAAEAAQHRAVERLMGALGVRAEDLVASSYEALLGARRPPG